MFAKERRQIYADFGSVPELVERHCPVSDHDEAVKMVRQISAVNTYLAWMATGETRVLEGVVYGTAIAAIDEVTDELGDSVSDGWIQDALGGEADTPRKEAVQLASELSRGPRFDRALQEVAAWQDRSLDQFGDIDLSQLLRVTRFKGGYSALAHLHMVKDNPSMSEDELMLDFGHLMQLLDDYLDQPKDEEYGISTVYTDWDFDRVDLEQERREMVTRCKEEWGDTTAVRRFDKLTRAHVLLGRVENDTPLRASWLVPWYV